MGHTPLNFPPPHTRTHFIEPLDEKYWVTLIDSTTYLVLRKILILVVVPFYLSST